MKQQTAKKKPVLLKKKVDFWKRVVFFLTMIVFFVVGLLWFFRPTSSQLEKRELTQFPAFTPVSFWDGSYFSQIDTWYADTFPWREGLMTANTYFRSLYGIQTEQMFGEHQVAEEIPDTTSGDTSRAELEETVEPVPPATTVDGAIQAPPESAGSVYLSGDRAYSLYYFGQENSDRYAAILNAYYDNIKAANPSANVYSILAPLAYGIDFSDEVMDEMNWSHEDQAIDYLFSRMDGGILKVDPFDTLRSHQDEYLYFRTDHHWTALGAYYAYSDFCQVKGIAPHDLSSFNTLTFDNFLGTMYASSNQAPALAANPDTVIAYEPNGVKTLTAHQADGTVLENYRIIADVSTWNSSSKYNCFIAGDQPYEEIHNPNITDGSSAVVVKDSYGNAFVPFLVDHYQDVYVIDFRYYSGSISQFVGQNQIDDVIFLNNLNATGAKSLLDSLQRCL